MVSLIALLLIISMTITAGIKNSNDTTFTDITIAGLDDAVKVYRDKYGVPTIIGSSLSDIVFGQGFEFARDRGFQLEFYRSLINDQLAALFGPDLVDTDIVLRTVGLKHAAELMKQKLTVSELSLVESYVRGINTYFKLHPNNKPVELEILGAEQHPWEVTDTIAMGSIVAFTFAFSGLNDEISFVKAIDKLGMQQALDLYPVDFQPAYNYLSNITSITYPNKMNQNGLSLSEDTGTGFDVMKALEPLFRGPHAELLQGYMSNNWVVSGNKTASGHPILANDPHTSLEAQGIWHRVNLMSYDGSILLQGFNFPGTPLLSFGHNAHFAWGVTSGIMDSVDLYYLNMNATHYLYNGSDWRAFETEQTTIKVSGADSVTRTIRRTAFGPLISTELGEYAMQWTLNINYARDNPIKSLIGFNLATTIEEAHNALEYMLTGFNWVFASNTGDIAYQHTGFIPVRRDGYGLIPKNGSAVNQGWDGLIPYQDQLHVVNPSSGYFATANERVDTRELFYISESYAPRHRNDRIEQVLANATDFDANPNALTIEDMQKLQTDVKTLVAEDLIDPERAVFASFKSQTTDPMIVKAIEQLLNWDYRLDVDSIAGLIFSTYRFFLIDSTLRDEMGDLVDSYGKGTRVLTDWYREGIDNHWFDNITTAKNETADDMAIISLERTVAYLSNRFGSDMSTWKWGDKHHVYLPHTFDSMTNLLNIGDVPAPGSSNTVNAIAGPSWNNGDIDYQSSYGPYFRVVYEVEPTWSNIWVVVSSGASGNPLSPHYDDAFQSWISFDYYHWHSSRSYVETNYEYTAIFRRTT